MSDWVSLQLKPIDFGADKFGSLVQKMADYLDTLASILDAFLKFVQDFDDPLTQALKAIIDEIKSLIEGLLDQAGGYMLYVPIAKRFQTNFLGLGDITPNWASSLGIFESDVSPIDYNDPGLSKLLTDANRYAGGNAGFFRIILDSLYDTGDLNRPQFYNDADYIGGVTLLTGTGQDPLGILDDLWTLGGMFNLPDSMPRVPRPKNLTAKVLRHTSLDAEGSEYEFDTFLTWDPPEPAITTLRDLGGATVYPDRYAIIRCKNDVGALAATNIIDLMGSRSISNGDTSTDGKCTVIYEDTYNLTDVNYLDKNVVAARDDTFYYVIAWKLKGNNPDDVEDSGNETTFDYWHISNVARVVPYSTIPDSTYPDWLRTPSVASMFPSIAVMLRRMTAYIEGIAGKIISVSATHDSYVQVLRDEVLFYEQLAGNILAQVEKLENLFKLPASGVYARSFSGLGGNRFFISDLASSLVPKPGKIVPPFHKGDEYVTGVVILAGGPKPSIEAFLSALNLFIDVSGGSISNKISTTGETAPTYIDEEGNIVTDTVSNVLADLDSAITQAEEITFKDNLTIGKESKSDPIFTEKTIQNIAQCSKPETPVIEFGPNMEVITDANV